MIKSPKDRGAVLLMTLLVMSVMATLAVAIMDEVRLGVKRAIHVQDYAQADWHVRSAEDFAATYITANLNLEAPETLSQPLLLAEPFVFPFDGGLMSISVKDGSQCISLSDVSSVAGEKRFVRLMETLDFPPLEALRIAALAADWADPDIDPRPSGAEDYSYLAMTPSYRAANAPFTSVMELRSLPQMTEETYAKIRPYVCARPKGELTKINVNTLTIDQAPLLASALGGRDNINTAQRIIAERPLAGYPNLQALIVSPAILAAQLQNTNYSQISYAPSHLWVEVDVQYQNARRKVVLEYKLDEGTITRQYRRLTDEARRPVNLDQTQ